MAYVRRVVMLSVGVAVGLFALNFVLSRFAPQFKGYLGLS